MTTTKRTPGPAKADNVGILAALELARDVIGPLPATTESLRALEAVLAAIANAKGE